MAAPENGNSRQRSFRLPFPIDDWLAELASESRKKDPESHAGIATEGNALLLKAFKADPRNKKKLHLVAHL